MLEYIGYGAILLAFTILIASVGLAPFSIGVSAIAGLAIFFTLMFFGLTLLVMHYAIGIFTGLMSAPFNAISGVIGMGGISANTPNLLAMFLVCLIIGIIIAIILALVIPKKRK